MAEFEFEIRKVSSGVDRDGNRVVDLNLRTANIAALMLAAKIGSETLKVKVLE